MLYLLGMTALVADVCDVVTAGSFSGSKIKEIQRFLFYLALDQCPYDPAVKA